MKKNNVQDNIFVEDNLDMEQIKQLHNATLNFSNQCTEIKKLYITVIIAVITLLFNLLKDNYSSTYLYRLISALTLIISFIFYLLDVCSYYYQKKLRILMNNTYTKIKKRHNIKHDCNLSFNSNIIIKSLINSSMLIYYLIFIASLVVLLLYWR